jgi:pimeloyl-ACP methyl ester carboxylesterase
MPLPPWLPVASLMLHVFYLHGFASSPKSTKASYLAERLAEHGVTLRCPDFNQPDFQTLTMTRMLEQLGRELASIGPGPVALVGSSLGGTLAILAAARFGARIDRLVLLAPAVMFAKPGHHLLPPGRVEEWRIARSLTFFHYGDDADRPLDFGFYEDCCLYSPFETSFGQPTLIFQGHHDTSVDPHTVEQFARARPNVTLMPLDDDHQLTASVPRIWHDMALFLGLEPETHKDTGA